MIQHQAARPRDPTAPLLFATGQGGRRPTQALRQRGSTCRGSFGVAARLLLRLLLLRFTRWRLGPTLRQRDDLLLHFQCQDMHREFMAFLNLGMHLPVAHGMCPAR